MSVRANFSINFEANPSDFMNVDPKAGQPCRRLQRFEGLFFILPYAILWVIFLLGPMIYGFFISLHDWNPLLGSKFIGFKNYLDHTRL